MEASTNARQLRSHPPLTFIVIGGLFCAMFLVGFLTQLQTNEAFITNATVVNIYKPDWMILWQIPALLTQQSTSASAAAIIFGWGIELVYLGFVLGYEILHESVERSGRTMARIFQSLSWAIIAFNAYTDYLYGSFGGGMLGHVAFSLITSFIVGYFGTIGLYFIEKGWKRA